MDLIACSYENIGPFDGKKLTVQFLPGSYLVKAPIGSGKSFLFFDGPIFARYKRSSRPMLARTAQQGEIQIIFSLQNEVRCITRSLKQTKAGNDSVITHLYRVNRSVSEIGQQLAAIHGSSVILQDLLIVDLFQPYLEEISTTSQKEVENLIDDLLPSREVTLSSSVLLQDSDNIFEMTPATRITVFKQLFNLLDMDHARQQLADQKKTVQIRRQVLQENDDITSKFQRHLTALTDTIYELSQLSLPGEQLQNLLHQWLQQPLIQDLGHVHEQLQLTGFSLQGYDEKVMEKLIAQVSTAKNHQLGLSGQHAQLLTQQQQIKVRQEQLIQQIKKQETELTTITTSLAAADTDRLIQLQEGQKALQNELTVLYQQLPHTQAALHEITFDTLAVAKQRLTTTLQEGKRVQQQIETVQQQLTIHQQKKERIQHQVGQLTAHRQQLQTKVAEENDFHCDLIDGACPYIEVITKKAAHTLTEQGQHLEEQIKQLQEVDLQEATQEGKNLQGQLVALQEQTSDLKVLLQEIQRKELEKVLTQADQIEKKLQIITTQLHQYEQYRQQIAARQTQQIRLEQQIQALHDQQVTIQEELLEITTTLQGVEKKTSTHDLELLQQTEKQLQTIQQHLTQLIDVLTDRQYRQEELSRLEHQEGLLKELLTIFQKELLIVVLQDFLPVLEEIINTYLAQVVTFVLRFELPTSLQDSIELNIRIHDEKGKRAVKSLSGGQKAVLRLCRILAVSTLFKRPFLLLDETINSLDTDAIGRVAEMLKNFVDQQDMKLFVVTHATQIQEMELWNSIISWDDILGDKNGQA